MPSSVINLFRLVVCFSLFLLQRLEPAPTPIGFQGQVVIKRQLFLMKQLTSAAVERQLDQVLA